MMPLSGLTERQTPPPTSGQSRRPALPPRVLVSIRHLPWRYALAPWKTPSPFGARASSCPSRPHGPPPPLVCTIEDKIPPDPERVPSRSSSIPRIPVVRKAVREIVVAVVRMAHVEFSEAALCIIG